MYQKKLMCSINFTHFNFQLLNNICWFKLSEECIQVILVITPNLFHNLHKEPFGVEKISVFEYSTPSQIGFQYRRLSLVLFVVDRISWWSRGERGLWFGNFRDSSLLFFIVVLLKSLSLDFQRAQPTDKVRNSEI